MKMVGAVLGGLVLGLVLGVVCGEDIRLWIHPNNEEPGYRGDKSEHLERGVGKARRSFLVGSDARSVTSYTYDTALCGLRRVILPDGTSPSYTYRQPQWK